MGGSSQVFFEACVESYPRIGRRASGGTGYRPSLVSGQGTSCVGSETFVPWMLPLPAHIEGPLAWRRRGWRVWRRRTGPGDVPAEGQYAGATPPYRPVGHAQRAADKGALGTETAWVAA